MQGQVPDELRVQTQPQWAAAMWQRSSQAGRLPCRDIRAESGSGNRPDCLAALEACVGATALVAIASETRCWPQRPTPQEPP